jgi:hypothetical protein
MDVGIRDKMMNELASEAAGEFVHKYEIGDKQIKSSPETVLQYSIPYLTVRTLHELKEILKRHEIALKSLEADSYWIKVSAIVTAIFSVVLVILTIVLARYALEDIAHSQPAMMKVLQLRQYFLGFSVRCLSGLTQSA